MLNLTATPVLAEPELAEQIEGQSRELASLAKEMESLRDRVEGTEREIASVDERIDALAQKRDQLLKRQATLRTDRQTLQTRVAALSDSLAASLAVAYRLGDRSLVELLLAGADPLATERDLHYLRHLIAPIRDELVAWRQAREALAAVESELEAESNRLVQTAQELEARKTRLSTLRARRQADMAELEERLADGEARLADLRNRKARMEEELARIVVEQAPDPDPAPEPVPAQPAPPAQADEGGIPVTASVARGYGAALGVGNLKSEGLFFETRRGMPVRAVADGQVVFADWMSGLGQMVILRHAGGYLSLYAHNTRLLVAQGDQVRRGQSLAEAGRTAGRAEPGLYFEVRKGNRPVDPASWAPYRQARSGAG
ncbi:MAG: murein hydrolase activator EnvC family protein [Halothiobacillaceae bacterium]